MALLSITTVAGVGLGYPIAGLIAQELGLHAGFWFSAIVSGAALVAAIIVLPSPAAQQASRLDFISALLLGAALASLLLAITQGQRWGWASWRLLASASISVLLFIAWVHHELRTPHLLVDLRLVRDRSVLRIDRRRDGIARRRRRVLLLLATVVRYVQTPTSAGTVSAHPSSSPGWCSCRFLRQALRRAAWIRTSRGTPRRSWCSR